MSAEDPPPTIEPLKEQDNSNGGILDIFDIRVRMQSYYEKACVL